jgi:hypothetical protein
VVPPMTLKAAGSQATPPPLRSQPRAQVETSAAIEPDWARLSVPVPEADATLPPVTSLLGAAERAGAEAEVEAAAADAELTAADRLPQSLHAAREEHTPMAGTALSAGHEPRFEPETPPPHASPAHASIVAIDPTVDRGAADAERWRALAEQVSMQVLQRLDLFTDTDLKEQLARRLEPIVERASAELVGEITEHVGRLVGTYVSEAIEREIAAWKRDQQ